MYSDLQEDTLCLWWVELSKFIYVLLCQRICYFVLFERTKKCCNCLLSYLQLVFFACLLSDTVTFSWVLYYRSTGLVDVTLFGLTSQKSHQGGLELSEEVRTRMLQPVFTTQKHWRLTSAHCAVFFNFLALYKYFLLTYLLMPADAADSIYLQLC